MDISKIVDTTRLHALNLERPDTGEPLGITFMVRSMSSVEAKAARVEQMNRNMETQSRGRRVEADRMEIDNIEMAAAAIASWDWGDHQYNGERPELTRENVVRILKAEDWIYAAVVEAANDLSNFTNS